MNTSVYEAYFRRAAEEGVVISTTRSLCDGSRWQAHYKDAEDGDIGWGSTPEEAYLDLMEQSE